jgi:hypothetical protein
MGDRAGPGGDLRRRALDPDPTGRKGSRLAGAGGGAARGHHGCRDPGRTPPGGLVREARGPAAGRPGDPGGAPREGGRFGIPVLRMAGELSGDPGFDSQVGALRAAGSEHAALRAGALAGVARAAPAIAGGGRAAADRGAPPGGTSGDLLLDRPLRSRLPEPGDPGPARQPPGQAGPRQNRPLRPQCLPGAPLERSVSPLSSHSLPRRFLCSR